MPIAFATRVHQTVRLWAAVGPAERVAAVGCLAMCGALVFSRGLLFCEIITSVTNTTARDFVIPKSPGAVLGTRHAHSVVPVIETLLVVRSVGL